MLKLSMQAAINLLYEHRYNKTNIANLLGVTPLQVYYYATGRTKVPKPDICWKLYHNFEIDGKHILLNIYKDFDDLKHHYSLNKIGSNFNKNDTEV